jgi:hypothetical protein
LGKGKQRDVLFASFSGKQRDVLFASFLCPLMSPDFLFFLARKKGASLSKRRSCRSPYDFGSTGKQRDVLFASSYLMSHISWPSLPEKGRLFKVKGALL